MATGGPFRLPQYGEPVNPGVVYAKSIIVAATSSDGDEAVVLGSDTENVNLFDVAANTRVFDVKGYVETAFTASVTLSIGDSDDIAGFQSQASIGATSTGNLLVVDSDALDSDDVAAYTFSGGKFYPSSQSIDLDVSGAVPAVGRLRVDVLYAAWDSTSGMNLSTST